MRSFTCILLASLLVSLSLCSFAKESDEKRPSLMSQDISKFKKEIANKKRVASINKKSFHEKKSEGEEEYFNELPAEMKEGIRSIRNKHISYTATKRQLASNKAKKEVRNENKRSKSRNKKEMVEIMEDTDLDMEELPEEMKIAIHSVKKPFRSV